MVCPGWTGSCPGLRVITSRFFLFFFSVLWLRSDNLEALELMAEIMERLKESELKQAKETVVIYKFIVYID